MPNEQATRRVVAGEHTNDAWHCPVCDAEARRQRQAIRDAAPEGMKKYADLDYNPWDRCCECCWHIGNHAPSCRDRDQPLRPEV